MAGVYFSESRNIELSTIDHLGATIDISWTDVNVEKSFRKAAEKALPVIVIRMSQEQPNYQEIGSTSLWTTYTFTVDIFARSDAQRIDLADFIKTTIKDNWDYNVYSHNAQKNLDKTADGKITLQEFLINAKIEFGDTAQVKDRYRHQIVFNCKRNIS